MASMREMETVNKNFNCFGKHVLLMFKYIQSLVGVAFSLCKTIMKRLRGNVMDNDFEVNNCIIRFQSAFCNNPVLLMLNSMVVL